MQQRTTLPVRLAMAGVLAVSLASPLTALADDGNRPDHRPAPQQVTATPRAPQSRGPQDQQSQDQQRQRERQQAQQQQAQRAQQEQGRQEQARQEQARQLQVQQDQRDVKPSDHPSGNDRNAEAGKSFPQGKSPSNPDGKGVDKPFNATGQTAGSQGRNDFDGNNGCGNDNDFSDDNNGKCLGLGLDHARQDQQPQPHPRATAEVAGKQAMSDKDDKQVEARHDDRDERDNRDDRKDRDEREATHTPAPTATMEVAGAQATATTVNSQCVCPEAMVTATTQVAGAQVTPRATQKPGDQRVENDRDRDDEKVGVCHATGSASNPYVFITVDKHGAENGHAKHKGDVIGAKSAANCPKGAEVAGVQTQPEHQVPVISWVIEKCRTFFVVIGWHKPAEVAGAQATATPTPTAQPTQQPTQQPSATATTETAAATAVPTNTAVATATSTSVCVCLPEATSTIAPTAVASATVAPTQTATATVQPTATATTAATVQPTATAQVSGVQAKAINDHECVSTEWHWVINQLSGTAPSSITVTWANGQTASVPLDKVTDGNVAHYATTLNLNSPVVSATVNLPSGTTYGQFNLSHGPCF